MKYAIICRAPQQLVSDKQSFQVWVIHAIVDEKRELLRQSKRFMNLKIQIAHNADDFIHGFISVRIVGDIYKLSRIIKKSLYATKLG